MNAPEQPAPQSPLGEIPYWLRALIGTPLVLVGGLITTCFGMSLCAYILDRIGGGPPSLNLFDFMVVWLIFGAFPLVAGTLLLRTSPFGGRFWRRMLIGVSFLLLVVGGDVGFGPNSWHHLFRREKFPGTDAVALKHTLVTPNLEAEIAKGTNLLWCGTFQLAWNEACRLTGGDLQFEKDNAMISVLNRHSFTKESLDEASYVAMAGLVKDNIHDKIRRAVKEKFHRAIIPRFIPDEAITPRPQDFVAYACLYKNLSFPIPFERLDESLTFSGVRVPAFGIGGHKAALDVIYPQVLILDYQSEDDFVIELKTKSAGDRLILAKLQPKATLADTVMSVSNRIAQGHAETASTNDLMLVPRMKLDLTREYSELEGLHLIPHDPNVAKDLILQSAVQNTFFAMNEKGVELISEAHMAFGCAKQEELVPKHRMIFNKAFLILMQQRNAKTPYFAFWVDNPEVLTSWK
jgi:hypothetical protein